MPLSPAGLARPLIGNLDKSLVQRQIVTDRVLPAGVAAVVDPGTPSPVTSHTGLELTPSCGKIPSGHIILRNALLPTTGLKLCGYIFQLDLCSDVCGISHK